MKRNVFKAALVALCLTSIALPSHAFSLFGWLKKENSINAMIEHVPADTALFFGGISDKNLISASDELLAAYNVDNVGDVYAQLLESFPDTSGKAMALWLISDYYSAAAQGGEALYQRYGIDVKGASVVYLDGIYPVIRMALADNDAFMTVLEQAASESDFSLGSATVAGKKITTLELANEDDLQINIGFLVNSKTLTISLFSQNDSDAAKAQRFALTKPAQALSTDVWKQDGKDYAFSEYFRGYISLVNIAKTVFDPSSAGHQQLAAFIGDDMANFIENQGQCQADYVALASGMPRIVMGINDYQVNNDQMDFSLSFALEIKNAPVLTELQKLPGFIPSYLSTDANLALGYGVGLSVDTLSSVATNLWTQFTEAQFNCESLQALQEQVAGTNPAVLAMVTGMAQGLSGVSVGIFDFVADDSQLLGGILDGIVTVTAEKPEVLAALISNYVPFLQGTKIPTDGTAVSLADAGLPMQAYIAIKGKHLVAYSGDNGTRLANELANQPVVANGVSTFTFNYAKTADLMLAAAEPMRSLQDSEDCTEMYSSALLLKSLPAVLTAQDNITSKGYESKWTMKLEDISAFGALYGIDLTGQYNIQYMDYDCNWVDLGTETLDADGTGLYAEMDETGSCNIYESKYNWSNPIGTMIQTDSVNRYRESCDSEWEEDDSYDFSCQVLAPDSTGFYCLETSDGEQTLHRYLTK